MSITLTPEQEAWIQAHVATGDFASIEEAARQLIAERIAERAAEDRLMSGKREVLRVGALSAADLEAIAATEMDTRHQHLDCELK
jgi:antitoxin ParD1/3/4